MIAFLPALRQNGEFYFSCLYMRDSIGLIALNKDRLLLGKRIVRYRTVLQTSSVYSHWQRANRVREYPSSDREKGETTSLPLLYFGHGIQADEGSLQWATDL
jgi:hypothetical protein